MKHVIDTRVLADTFRAQAEGLDVALFGPTPAVRLALYKSLYATPYQGYDALVCAATDFNRH